MWLKKDSWIASSYLYIFFSNLQEGESEEKYLKTYEPGEAFGELALLYNAPRAATIKAKNNCTLWVLDRNTFNHIVKDASM